MNAVWGKGLLREKNIHLLFSYTLTPQKGDRLHLAASNLYRLFVGGKLTGYGPARAAQYIHQCSKTAVSARNV